MKINFKITTLAILLAAILASCASDPNIESAKLNLRNSDYQGVIDAANRALVENPDNADAFFYIGAAHLELADDKPVSERREDLQKARENMVRADELYREQEIASNEAESAISLLVARWQDEYSQGIGGIDFEVENPPEVLQTAIYHVYNAHAVMPDSTMNLDALSELYFMMDDVDNAVNYMEKAVDQSTEPDLTRYQRLAYFYQVKEDEQASLNLLERAADLFPDEIFFVQEQANIYFRQGENERAMEILQQLIETDPNNPQYRLVMGSQIYQEYLNMTDEIAGLYDRLFDLNSEFRDEARSTNPDLGKIERLENEMDEIQVEIMRIDELRFEIAERAEEQLLRAHELDPEEPNTTYTLGAINENRGLALLDQMNNLFTQDIDTEDFQQRARAYFEASLPFYELTAELEPEESDNWLKLFQVYTRLGMAEQAEEAAERAGL
ncbi:MAG: tetratricopeptide repeat protein [Balneolia bacterium]|nr:tetratricopeptide repeat protein [Balneolia bacterium]